MPNVSFRNWSVTSPSSAPSPTWVPNVHRDPHEVHMWPRCIEGSPSTNGLVEWMRVCVKALIVPRVLASTCSFTTEGIITCSHCGWTTGALTTLGSRRSPGLSNDDPHLYPGSLTYQNNWGSPQGQIHNTISLRNTLEPRDYYREGHQRPSTIYPKSYF